MSADQQTPSGGDDGGTTQSWLQYKEDASVAVAALLGLLAYALDSSQLVFVAAISLPIGVVALLDEVIPRV